MLNGLDPIIIFTFYKKLGSDGKPIPTDASVISKLAFPPIPIYLSESQTGLYIDAESKNTDIETNVDSLGAGGTPLTTQKALNSIVKVSMLAKKDSIGLNIVSSMIDLILPKVTSQEYEVAFIHGAVTIFRGLIHSFALEQDPESELARVSLEFVNVAKSAAIVTVPREPTVTSLNNIGTVPAGGAAGPAGGGAVPPTQSTLPLVNP